MAILRRVSCGTGSLSPRPRRSGFRRIKHWAGLPTEAIAFFCLREAGVRPGDVDHVAINRDPPSVNNLRRLLGFVLTRRPDFGYGKKSYSEHPQSERG